MRTCLASYLVSPHDKVVWPVHFVLAFFGWINNTGNALPSCRVPRSLMLYTCGCALYSLRASKAHASDNPVSSARVYKVPIERFDATK